MILPIPILGSPSARRLAPDWVILLIACVAQFMVVLDVSIVNVALPSIGHDLHYSVTGLQWVVNAYVLTFAGFLLLGGRAGDIYGRRRVYLSGLVLFAVASLVGGLADSSTWLTTARAFQGLGGAVLSPATLTILVTTFKGPQLVRALGMWSASAGIGGAAGGFLGGVLTSELSWRWVLFVNVPIAAGIALVAFAFLSESRRPEGTRHLDVAGAVTATGGLAAFIYALVGTDTHPWGSSHTLSFLGLAVFLIATFVFIETRVARQPLVPFRVFRSRSLMGANVVMLLAGGVFFAMWYFLSLFMQDVLGYDALKAGIAFLPMGIAVAVGAQISSRLLRRLSIRTMLLITTPIGAAGFFWVSRITDHSGYWTALFGPGLMLSLSLGLLFTPLASAATAGVQQSEAGLASGILNTSRQLGGSIGLAALATIAAQRTGSLITAHGTRPSMGAALTSGYSRAFVVAGFIAVVAFAASFIVPNRPPAGRGRAPEESKQTAPIEPAIGGGLALATETVLSNGANPTKRDIGSN